LALTSLAAGAGVLAYLGSAAHGRHDPFHALQQFDAFYLDEPAPALEKLGVAPGRAAAIFFCEDFGCDVPDLPAVQVVTSTSPVLARQYALLTEDGRVGPGYALVNSGGRVRYRTFDPGFHASEIAVLVDALR
jgi:hypothetical protein